MKNGIMILGLIFLFGMCTNPKKQEKSTEKTPVERIVNSSNKVILSSEIVFEKLNPARGDQSPQAGTIWGDRKGNEATGFLAKFVDGFSSPPHNHNVTYRAVVIKGLVHNDDPKAANMWMKPGSFWSQPEGESHITSAKGDDNIALVEINKGPYLVKGVDTEFDNGERPINIDVSNVVWLNSEKTNWVNSSSKAEISFLMESKGEDDLKSLFVKLPKGYNGVVETDGTVLHAVVIKGEVNYTMPDNSEVKVLDSGSYFGSTDKAEHSVSNNSEKEVIIYLRTNGVVLVK